MSNPLPDWIDCNITLRASQPLSNGRKAWPVSTLRYKWGNGLVGLKGQIETKVLVI